MLATVAVALQLCTVYAQSMEATVEVHDVVVSRRGVSVLDRPSVCAPLTLAIVCDHVVPDCRRFLGSTSTCMDPPHHLIGRRPSPPFSQMATMHR